MNIDDYAHALRRGLKDPTNQQDQHGIHRTKQPTKNSPLKMGRNVSALSRPRTLGFLAETDGMGLVISWCPVGCVNIPAGTPNDQK